MRVTVLALLLLAGCASGPYYWTKPGATAEMFKADHEECARGAAVGYGIGSERAYKACLSQKNWTRIQGRGTQPPDVPHFRGIEGDDEFARSSPEQLKDQLESERMSGRERYTGDAYQCARARIGSSQNSSLLRASVHDRRDLRRPMNQQNTLGALEAFIREHEYCGELDSGERQR